MQLDLLGEDDEAVAVFLSNLAAILTQGLPIKKRKLFSHFLI